MFVLWLVVSIGRAEKSGRKGKSVCHIVAGLKDQIAAKSLQNYLRKQFKIAMDIVEPRDTVSGEQRCEILLGTGETNPYLTQIAKKHNVELDVENLTDDGYVLRTFRDQERDVVFVVGGDKRGVFYAVGELKNYYLRQTTDSVVVLPAAVCEVPTFKYRWFWTWDWRMEWGGVEPGGSKMGGGGSYRKKPESFLVDYKPCIDYMAENGFNGLVIWGFIRDSHSGVAAAFRGGRKDIRVLVVVAAVNPTPESEQDAGQFELVPNMFGYLSGLVERPIDAGSRLLRPWVDPSVKGAPKLHVRCTDQLSSLRMFLEFLGPCDAIPDLLSMLFVCSGKSGEAALPQTANPN